MVGTTAPRASSLGLIRRQAQALKNSVRLLLGSDAILSAKSTLQDIKCQIQAQHALAARAFLNVRHLCEGSYLDADIQ